MYRRQVLDQKNRTLSKNYITRALKANAFICGFFLFFALEAAADARHDHVLPEPTFKLAEPQFTEPYQPRVVRKAAQTTLGQPAVFGQWSDVESWPVIAVHANLLPNGKVLAWDATPDDTDDDPHTTDNYTTRVSLWDPITNIHIPTNNDTNADLFCAGSAQLWDGRLLFSGGDSGRNGLNAPLPNTNIYDPITNTWSSVANMAAPRWYASVAALANGEMLTYAGRYVPVPIAEVFQFDETWRGLDIQEPIGNSIDYQWMQATPEGNVMSFGPQNTLTIIDTEGSGSLTLGPKRDNFTERRYGSYAMYDIGKVLVSGGTIKDGGEASFTSSVVIDTATQQSTDTGSMAFGRTQHNLTILADGSVLATGGNTDGAALVSEVAGVYRPELWSPVTDQWQPMNDMQIDRQYHAIALLLPDGRVLSSGGGYCGTCYEIGYEEKNAEIFSPPYLFSSDDTLAIRPVITAAPEVIDYAYTYSVSTDQTNLISKVHLIKLGAVTHSQNQDQRLVPLSFSRSDGALQITAPDNRNIAPPGHYMLIVLNNSGVPSVSKIIRVGQPLLTSGASVTNALRPNESDEYVIESADSDDELLVTLSGQSSELNLQVIGVVGNDANTAACTQSGQEIECRVSNQQATRWYIRITGKAATPYVLVSELSTAEDSDVEQSEPGDESVMIGSGYLDFSLALSLCALAGWRRKTLLVNL